MMEDRHDEEAISHNPIDDRKREASQKHSTAVLVDERRGRWHARRNLHRRIERTRELLAQAGDTGLVPSLGIKGLDPRLRSEDDAHQRVR